MKINNRHVYVFDNEGETFDRFTIVIGSNGELLGSSNNPFHGFGQHCGNLVDKIMFHKYGSSWRKYCAVAKIVKHEIANYLNEARSNAAWLGKEITDPAILPVDVLRFIKQSL